MKVLHLVSSFGFFGPENVVLTLAHGQREQGMTVWVGVFRNRYNPHLELAEKAREQGIPVAVFDCAAPVDPRTVVAVRKFIRDHAVDVVHSHGYKTDTYAALASRALNIRKIGTCHGWCGGSLKARFYEVLDKRFLRGFDRVVVVSGRQAAEAAASGIPENKIRVVANGLDPLRFAAPPLPDDVSLKRELGITEADAVVCSVGRLSKEKGHVYLVRAFPEIVRAHGNARLLLVGDGPERTRLAAEARRRGVRGRVIFAGFREDAAALMRLADIFVLPSLREGVPLALLEAMVAQKAIVATAAGGVPGIIDDGRSGLLVRPEDSAALARAVVSLLSGPAKREFLARNAFERVRADFSVSRMTQEYLSVYRAN